MQEKSNLRAENAPENVKVFQLTDNPEVPSCHVYMEAPVFTPDSKRLVLHRGAHPHGPCKDDPRHAYMLCDLENGGQLSPLTLPEEYSSTSTAVSPDGKWFYYFVDKTKVGEGELILKRVRLDGTERETLFVLDDKLCGTRFRASRPYPLATISADGAKIALQVFLGDGYTRSSPHGLLVFDLAKGSYSLPLWGPSLCNMHAQYSRSKDPERVYDLLIQENHGYISNVLGDMINVEKDGFVDLHVMSDDGSNLRDLPMGGNAMELCSGHQCWRGDSEWVISSVISIYGRGLVENQDFRLIEALPVPHQGHLGAKSWRGERNEISGNLEDSRLNHFGVDAAGELILSEDSRNYVSIARMKAPGAVPAEKFTRLVDTRMQHGFRNAVDSHPFLSPDGKRGFFNSNESGKLQAYMIDGLDSLSI